MKKLDKTEIPANGATVEKNNRKYKILYRPFKEEAFIDDYIPWCPVLYNELTHRIDDFKALDVGEGLIVNEHDDSNIVVRTKEGWSADCFSKVIWRDVTPKCRPENAVPFPTEAEQEAKAKEQAEARSFHAAAKLIEGVYSPLDEKVERMDMEGVVECRQWRTNEMLRKFEGKLALMKKVMKSFKKENK